MKVTYPTSSHKEQEGNRDEKPTLRHNEVAVWPQGKCYDHQKDARVTGEGEGQQVYRNGQAWRPGGGEKRQYPSSAAADSR